ncbi:MAG: hypothetical protein N2489_01915 [Clostridia bacterium]|nr:hypothetical protein [Clostridia bacterium]
MDNIIKQVIESEYRAQKIINEVENESKQAVENLEKEIQKIRDEIFLSMMNRAASIKAEKLEQAKVKAEEILDQTRARTARMMQKLEENRGIWVQQLLDHVLR